VALRIVDPVAKHGEIAERHGVTKQAVHFGLLSAPRTVRALAAVMMRKKRPRTLANGHTPESLRQWILAGVRHCEAIRERDLLRDAMEQCGSHSQSQTAINSLVANGDLIRIKGLLPREGQPPLRVNFIATMEKSV